MITTTKNAVAILFFSVPLMINAAPAASASTPIQCPVTSTVTSIYTGEVIAPGKTYPYTTTVTLTDVTYPLTTSTESGAWTYEGETGAYTNYITYTNYYGPFPTDCS